MERNTSNNAGQCKSGRFNLAFLSIPVNGHLHRPSINTFRNKFSLTWLYYLLVLFLVLIILGGCTGAGTSEGGNSGGGGSGNNTPVGLLEFETLCADCHGEDGAGSDIHPGLKRDFKLEDLEYMIEVSMPPTAPGECTGICAQNVAEYIKTHFSGTAELDFSIKATGQSLYEAGCSSCHGLDGSGVGVIPGLTRDISITDLTTIIETRMPILNPAACVGECAALTAEYIFNNFSLPATSPPVAPPVTTNGAVLYNNQCAGCHGVDGLGVGAIIGLTRDLSVVQTAQIIENTMPTSNPGLCVGSCATDIAQYIFDNFRIALTLPPPEPGNGESMYVQVCATCHGLDGRGVLSTVGVTRNLTIQELVFIIGSSMPPNDPNGCSGNCALYVAQYIADNFTLPPEPAPEPVPEPTPEPPPPTSGNGEALYSSEGCASCHGLDGLGVGTIIGVDRNMTEAELTTIIDTRMPPANPGACIGSCASDIAGYIFANFTDTSPAPAPAPVPPPVTAGSGEQLYSTHGCAGCHGLNGQGIGVVVGVTRSMTEAELTTIIEGTMPPTNPTLCSGTCATEIASYIFANFTSSEPVAASKDPLGTLPTGQTQTSIACQRMAQSGEDHVVRDLFCGPNPPRITSIVELQRGLGLEFINPDRTRGNPRFAITGHSSSLVAKFTNAINPRAVIFSRPGLGFVTIGFARGDQFVEVIVNDRNRNRLSFFLVAFELPCNATESCTNGDILTPAVESGWTKVTLYGEEDLKNTIVDCRHCHQLNGPGTQKILRMQELREPWNHWFSDERGGLALIADFRAAHGNNENYAGIPAALIDNSDPEDLEDFVIANGFRNQPNEFNSERIEGEVRQSSPGQPQSNDIPGVSATWNILYERSKQGLAIPPPYHDVKVTDSAKLATLTQAYQNYLNGTLAPQNLPDLRDAFLDSNLFEIGFAVEPGLDGRGIIMQACSQCHNSNLDQTISRARFNVDLNAMSDTQGGILRGSARDLEIGIAIQRIQLPHDNVRVMPPSHGFRDLTGSEIQRVKVYLCSQTSVVIAQCL